MSKSKVVATSGIYVIFYHVSAYRINWESVETA